MAAKTQIVSIGDTAEKKFFKASAVLYTTDNAAVTGISPATGTNASVTPLYDTAELMRVGLMQRLNVRCRTGSGKFVTYGLFIDAQNVQAANQHYNTDGKTLNGNTVVSASYGRRQVMK